MQSTDFVALLNQLAPLELAESWDNVGVLLQREHRPVRHVLLTIDLTQAVLREALVQQVDAIVSYHPPIFAGIKRIVTGDPKGHIVAELLHAGVLVYSPHTALDAAVGGVNDWLIGALPTHSVRPITPALGAMDPRVGQGRIGSLTSPLPLGACVTLIKKHLGLAYVRVSAAPKHEHAPIASLAVCAGAGGSLLARCSADLLLTGEMRHHDVLDQRERGVSIVLTDHTNSERGYLNVLAERLSRLAPALSIAISKADADPLSVH
jgi:dinuclear metal center YbgI/SA1388 family protein